MDKQLKKGTIASELIIFAMEMKGKRPTQLNFEEMIDVVEEVVNKISSYPMLADSICHHPLPYRVAKSDTNYECSKCGKFV